MGQLRNFVTANHIKAKRDYAPRTAPERPDWARRAKRFDFDYFDGTRDTGYGGYRDDGRWAPVAANLLKTYDLPEGARVLDIGCGKGFLLNEFRKLRPDLRLEGIEISSYALELAAPEIRPYLRYGKFPEVDLPAKAYDLVLSLNVLHNVDLPDLHESLKRIEAASKGRSFICIESYRNEEEKWNLLRWALTCEAYFTPREWEWIFSQAGYTGDWEYIYFE